MNDRAHRIDTFLTSHGWENAERSLLADDASFRRYERLRRGDGTTAVLMDAPPPKEDVGPFVTLARHLAKVGLSAPKILAEDHAGGLLLLEDLGDRTYTREIADGGDEEALYALAIDALVHIHGLALDQAIPRALPPYDNRRMLEEARLFIDWYLPAVLEDDLSEEAHAAYDTAWKNVLKDLGGLPPTLVLRDFHVDNLIWLPDRDGIRACGLLDFQDAVRGPAAYDLMSLLEDARRDLDDGLSTRMLARYLAAFPSLDRETFGTAFAILGAQRHAKVIGIFTRLCHRDEKPDYLAHIPRVWRLLERALGHPALTEVRTWIDTHVPLERRIQPSAQHPEAAE